MADTVYVVVDHDRRAGTGIRVFGTAEAAVAYAYETALEGANGNHDLVDETQTINYLYYATYRSDENSIFVQEQIVQN